MSIHEPGETVVMPTIPGEPYYIVASKSYYLNFKGQLITPVTNGAASD